MFYSRAVETQNSTGGSSTQKPSSFQREEVTGGKNSSPVVLGLHLVLQCRLRSGSATLQVTGDSLPGELSNPTIKSCRWGEILIPT